MSAVEKENFIIFSTNGKIKLNALKQKEKSNSICYRWERKEIIKSWLHSRGKRILSLGFSPFTWGRYNRSSKTTEY
jgi:hypothetical protein